MGAPEDEHIFGVQLRESANDGSDFPNADADYRKLFLGEDGILHLKDSAGTVTDIGGGGITVEDEGTPLATAATTLDFVGSGVVASGTGATKTITISGGGGGGLTLLEQHTASASATVDFTSFISSSHDVYFFTFTSLVMGTDNVNLWMRMGTGGGPTYDTGNNYSYETFVWRAGANAVGGSTAQSKIIMDFAPSDTIESGTAALAPVNGEAYLFDPQNASRYKTVHGRISYYDASPFRVTVEFRGGYDSTTAVTAVRFMASSGNIDSGTIRVYGLEK